MTESPKSFQDRARGALMGAFIGDALGLGPHWYYDLDELRRQYGPWISDYTEPKPGHYHSGMKAGELSQDGLLLKWTLESLVEKGRYDEADFCARLERELFAKMDGSPHSGPGGYTSQSIREAYAKRQAGWDWSEVAGNADTTEALHRCLAIAVRYARTPRALAEQVTGHAALLQNDGTVLAITCAFSALLGMLVEGERFDAAISGKLMGRVKSGQLPFHAVTSGDLEPPKSDSKDNKAARPGEFPSPDALLTPGSIARAATDLDIRIEPAWKVATLYGLPCAVYHVVPASYYLAARFPDDFESAVLNAINGGGQNLTRAMLAGALVGAMVGLSGIPQRFVDGLVEKDRLLELTAKLAEQAEAA